MVPDVKLEGDKLYITVPANFTDPPLSTKGKMRLVFTTHSFQTISGFQVGDKKVDLWVAINIGYHKDKPPK